MRRVGITVLLLGSALLASCGGVYFFGFVSNPGGTTTVSGVVIAVSGGFVSDPTGLVSPVTTVTLTNGTGATTLNFCGDQKSLFPMTQDVRAEYTPGALCNTLVNVMLSNSGG